MADSHKNFAYSTLASVPSPALSGTTLIVASGQGALFPTVPFNVTVWPTGVQATAVNAEIMRVTNIATDTFTVTRAQESTTAKSFLVGAQIAATITAKTLTDVEGTIVGPGSSTDNAIVRFNGATGLLAQNSGALVDDSGYLQLPDGAVTTPAVTFISDPNSGIYSAGADSIGIACGANARLLADSTGVTLLGATTSVNEDLSVLGSVTVGTTVLVADTPNGFVGMGTASPSTPLHVVGTSTLAGEVVASGTITGATAGVYVNQSVTVDNGIGFGAALGFGGTVTAGGDGNNVIGLDLNNIALATGGFTGTTFYGLRIPSISGGGTNYAIYTGTGLVRFGGALTVASGGITVTGNSTITGTLSGVTALVAGTNGLLLSGTVSNAEGGFYLNHSTTVPNVTGGGAHLLMSGTLTQGGNSDRLACIEINPVLSAGGFTAGIHYGINLRAITTGTTNYSIYSAGGDFYHAGIVGLGIAPSSSAHLTLLAGTTAVAPLRITHGSAPSSPVDGDMWTTTAGLYVRINGGTVGPLS